MAMQGVIVSLGMYIMYAQGKQIQDALAVVEKQGASFNARMNDEVQMRRDLATKQADDIKLMVTIVQHTLDIKTLKDDVARIESKIDSKKNGR